MMTSLSKPMRYETATDEQLKVITSHDKHCPSDLLRGAVSEIMKRDNYDNLIWVIIKKIFYNTTVAREELQMDNQDILATGYEAIALTLKNYIPGKSSFSTLAYKNIHYAFLEIVRNQNMQKREGDKELLHYHTKRDCGETYEYFIPDTQQNVEKIVMKKLQMEELTDRMTAEQRESFLLFMKGYTYDEIGERVGRSKSVVFKRINGGLFQATGKQINLRSLGIMERSKQNELNKAV